MVKDLHRPYIDNVILKIDGEEYTRIEDVFDCWFESGSMPYAQVHTRSRTKTGSRKISQRIYHRIYRADAWVVLHIASVVSGAVWLRAVSKT